MAGMGSANFADTDLLTYDNLELDCLGLDGVPTPSSAMSVGTGQVASFIRCCGYAADVGGCGRVR